MANEQEVLDRAGLQTLIEEILKKVRGEFAANAITFDTAMSTTSTNPVQNKVIDAAIKAATLHYGTCTTAAATAAKVATVDSGFSLKTGMGVLIKMSNANTVATPTLNVNNSGAKTIRRYGSTSPSTSAASSWNAGSIIMLVYDGSVWQMVGWLNTTYSLVTTTTNGLMSAADKDILNHLALTATQYATLSALLD